ncbi:MAG TPA: branched-chain amino acid ABC transporter permease [Desulfotomaculum sp.]|nr:MAG: ABC transporter permease [Desulfotomaculum sp. BICA1-6]HBX22069.1 branched-chain amino acid ABC transporter permease [Desulfotomaculum sp.]
MKKGYRKERLDRGIKARTDDIFAICSPREIAYIALPRFIVIGALLVFPLLAVLTGIYWQNVLIITCTIALLALSWDLLASAGLVSLGQALFFGAGAYVTGFLSHHYGWPPILSVPAATVTGALLCTMLLYPVLRLRGIYFGLITFAMPLLMMRIVEATKILGGTEGLSGLAPLPGMKVELYVIITVTLVCVFGFRRLIDTDYGLVLRAIRDNDRAVMAGGINIQWYKTQAVFIAALPATFAGAFLTHHYQFVGMPAFALEYSILPLTSVIIGGTGSFAGAMLGAFILVPLSEVLRAFGTLRVVIYCLILLVFAIGLPEGIFHYIQRKYYQFERLVPVEEIKK